MECWEHGRFLMLGADGILRRGAYSQYLYIHGPNPSAFAGRPSEIRDIVPATREDLISFDRLNRSSYRESKKRARDEAWRRYLGTNWQIRVPHAGMEASLALKRLKEQGVFTQTLQMSV